MTNNHLIAPLRLRHPHQRPQIRRRDDLTRLRIPIVSAIILQVPIHRLTQIPPVLPRELALPVPPRARLVPHAHLHVADAPRDQSDRVQRRRGPAAERGPVVGAGEGAEEEVGARGPAVGEEGMG